MCSLILCESDLQHGCRDLRAQYNWPTPFIHHKGAADSSENFNFNSGVLIIFVYLLSGSETDPVAVSTPQSGSNIIV